MGFFTRLFSSDYRAAQSAEAAGDLDLAAERYAMAGHPHAAVRMHLARAARARTSTREIDALRDAMHWVAEDDEQRSEVWGRLGSALLVTARAEGIATERDRERVAEAAELLSRAEKHQEAGDAWLLIDKRPEAIRAFSAGGHVERLERILDVDAEVNDRQRTVRQSFADYEVHMRAGARNAARTELRAVVNAATNKAEYQRLLDALESRLISGGRVTFRPRRGPAVVVCAASPVCLGRDALCDLMLRSGGVSRRHAEILVHADPEENDERFELRDAGSRNGTLLAGLPIQGSVPLKNAGTFELGEAYSMEFEVSEDHVLTLTVRKGLEAGTHLVVGIDGQPLDLSHVGLAASITFHDGYPVLTPSETATLHLNDELLAHGTCQLIGGDRLGIDGTEVNVT